MESKSQTLLRMGPAKSPRRLGYNNRTGNPIGRICSLSGKSCHCPKTEHDVISPNEAPNLDGNGSNGYGERIVRGCVVISGAKFADWYGISRKLLFFAFCFSKREKCAHRWLNTRRSVRSMESSRATPSRGPRIMAAMKPSSDCAVKSVTCVGGM